MSATRLSPGAATLARLSRWLLPLFVVAVLVAMLLPGGGDISKAAAVGSSKCGTFNLAVNNWVGYEADAYVVGEVAEKKLGCIVNYIYVDEQVSWQGFASGQVDAILENWGHEDLAQLYIKQQKVALDAGPIGINGVIGWYVPPWMKEKYPDITNWKKLNSYADLFKTTESGGKGQLLDGDPGFVTNDEALVKNLHLDFNVVFAGSEAALIQAFRTAQQQKKPLIGYFYSPQWFLSEVPLVKVDLPKYTAGCDAVASKVACDYPTYHLNKVVSTTFAEANGPAYQLVKNWTWSDTAQNLVAKWITEDGMSPEKAAQKWIDANPDKVNAWLR
ncbi:MAG: ABC transporter substrate-binding protein [Nocardioides sp.]|uniref:ABC transporter substrate-binding protein n=1 Tax=Nocardioides sp. TaxID=35761 RepID=UPI0039E40BAA